MSDAPSLHINPDIFFLFAGQDFAVWNFQTHEQFALSKTHVAALLEIAAGESIADESPVADLLAAGILTTGLAESSGGTWQWDALAKIFHIGTSFPYSDFPAGEADPGARSRQYAERCDNILEGIPPDAFSFEKGHEVRQLGTPAGRDGIDLFDALRDRTSTRHFSNESISFDSISTVLTETFSYREHLIEKYHAKGLDTPTKRRSSPSGGSLQCSEAYLVARRVDGLDPGVYHYRSHANSIALVSPIQDSIQFGTEYLAGQAFSDDAAAFIVITSRLHKMWWKYQHSRAYRVACLDTGHLSQTAQLIATGFQLRTWITAAFFDEKLRKLLAIAQHEPEYPMLVLGFGSGDADPVDKFYQPIAATAIQE
ncbi:MAG: SagB/ThcOx family dehydrogenase [Pseudomonadota bacterium]